MKTLVVGYSEAESSARALVRAAELAKAFQAHLVVVSVTAPTMLPVAEPVVEPTLATPIGALAPVEAGESAATRPADVSGRELDLARAALAGHDVDAEYVAEVGDPADRLLAVADERDADLIVVGSREHGFLERLLVRPVEETVARRTDRDVLLVH